MKMRYLLRWPALSALGALAGCCLVGCGSKNDDASGLSTPPAPAALLRQQRHAADTNLQAHLDALGQRAHEHDPAKRPLILSERAANRQEWAARLLKQGYAQSGHTNASWDAQVNGLFDQYAVYRLGAPERYRAVTQAVAAARSAGCDDPLIRYMQTRYGLSGAPDNPSRFALDCLSAFEGMLNSRYHPVFKFLTGYRCVLAARDADVEGDRRAAIELANELLEDLARDTNAPVEEVFEPAFLWVDFGHGKGWVNFVMGDLQGILEKNWGQEEPFFRLRGSVEISLAWVDRGGGFADSVTAKGWEGFAKHLSDAQGFLENAWRLNPSNAQTAYLMMQVELGQGEGRPRMEQWFRRAMKLAPNYYDAANQMCYYLEPRWYGSEDQALEFARACVASTNYTGSVPLVLRDLHDRLAKFYKQADSPAYWERPAVWADVRSSYEKFFQLNPDAYGWRHNYARDAFRCAQYQTFLDQTRLFNTYTNFEFFGGAAKFREMLSRAVAAGGSTAGGK